MRRTKLFTSVSVGCVLAALGIFVYPSYADENYIYGTMEIPYDAFYKAEGIDYEVDAVSSATDSKWKNENLTAGTYHQENADGTGTILGVDYYVALTEETLAALGENTYHFTAVDTVPDAYKIVTVEDGNVVFSAVQGETAQVTASAEISSDTPWGDYQITVDALNNSEGTSDIGRIYGVILTTQDGDHYAMRHLENIWRDNLAWSNGFVTKESHGNTLNYEDFDGIMGQTITEITYITDSGYHNLAASLYVPIKFNGILEAADTEVTEGIVPMTLADFPDDYQKEYSIEGLNAEILTDQIVYQKGMPGQYTLIVRDGNGVYADVKTNFVLFTEESPAVYKDGKIMAAEGAAEETFQNYLKNIATVSVNGTEYTASGRRSVKIIQEDGSIDLNAERNEEKIFAESGTYQIVVSATGYHTTLEFSLDISSDSNKNDEKITTDSEEKTTTNSEEKTTTGSEETITESSDAQIPANSDIKQKTNAAGVLVPVAIAACLAGAVVVIRKKR